MTVPLSYFLVLAAALFATGAVGFLLRRNLLVLLMSIELMLNAVNLTLVAINRMHVGSGAAPLKVLGGVWYGQVGPAEP